MKVNGSALKDEMRFLEFVLASLERLVRLSLKLTCNVFSCPARERQQSGAGRPLGRLRRPVGPPDGAGGVAPGRRHLLGARARSPPRTAGLCSGTCPR